MADIPRLTLLSGFDPYLVSYVDRQAVLPREHKGKVILKSGICLPTVAVDGQVVGVWNIKKNEPVVEFFTRQPKAIVNKTYDLVDALRWQTAGQFFSASRPRPTPLRKRFWIPNLRSRPCVLVSALAALRFHTPPAPHPCVGLWGIENKFVEIAPPLSTQLEGRRPSTSQDLLQSAGRRFPI